MSFSEQTWRDKLREKLSDVRSRAKKVGRNAPYPLYGLLCGLSLWPAVEAAQSGQAPAAILASLGIAASIGTNLIANQIQQWVDAGPNASDADVIDWATEMAGSNAEARKALDDILERLEVIPQATSALNASDKRWFVDTLHKEMAKLGNLPRFENVIIASVGDVDGGQVAFGHHIDQRQVIVNGTAFLIADPTQLGGLITSGTPTEDLNKAIESYLVCLIDHYRYLDFRGMGISDRVPLRLPLREMYVPLKARLELPEGETWARDLRLAGHAVSAEEAEDMGRHLTEPQPVLNLLRDNDGLIILGDPGAGKTTFLKYLALHLAQGEGQALQLGNWLPILLPLSAYANELAERDISLVEFIAVYYKNRGIDLPIDRVFADALREGGALILLDGLDEVREYHTRNLVLSRVNDFFSYHRQKGNKFIVTSRIVGYRQVRQLMDGMTECTLVDFEDEDIGRFIEKWTSAVERAASGDTMAAAESAATEREELLLAVERNTGVRRLASSPLLLTILALMKRQGVALPDRRVELYQNCIETLLRNWNLARGLDARYARDCNVRDTLRVLAPLARWMHEANPGIGLVKHADVEHQLVRIFTDRHAKDPAASTDAFLDDVHHHAGLLLERGSGEYGFIHLTFQEYLTAVAIGMLGQQDVTPIVDVLSDHVSDPDWREVSLLTIGYVGIIQQRDEAAGDVLMRLIERAPGEPGEAAALAGLAAADVCPEGIALPYQEQISQALLDVMGNRRATPRLRASTGVSLARLGDPRPEVMTIEGMHFCYVPAGPFWMGEGSDEHLNESLTYDYWMGRYPVTNAQFRPFVEDPKGYRNDRWWTKDGLAWRADRTGPRDYGEPFNLSNHPVVGITWYEALAYTLWLTEEMRAAGALPDGYRVRLPSETEWEKAARGGLEIPAEPAYGPAGATNADRLTANSLPKRRYPWGDEADPDLANYRDSGIDATSAVGCFYPGRSPYGCEEMSGNIWEWTRSLWGEKSEDEDGASDVDRVLRGGSFSIFAAYVRCADRFRNGPDFFFRDFGVRVVVVPTAL